MFGPVEDIKKFCVLCMLPTWKANSYWILNSKVEKRVQFSTGEILELEPYKERQVSGLLAGRPFMFSEMFSLLAPEDLNQVYIDATAVGIWAQTEFFGLRVCGGHLWSAKDLWQSGGNRNWSS